MNTVAVPFAEEAEVINRNNYLLINEHIQYLGEVLQLSEPSRSRYKFHLRHLLLWADETLLSKSYTIRPAFPSYVSSLPGKDGQVNMAASTQKKIIEFC